MRESDGRKTHNNNRNTKEITMETNSTFECGICNYQSLAKNFTPITVSANFAALECPKCLNNDEDSFAEVDVAVKKAA
jgi:transcription elongation factor Elf1